MGHRHSIAAYENCAPRANSPEFCKFDSIVKTALLASVGVLPEHALCPKKTNVKHTDSDVHKFIVKACISAILCELIYLSRAEIAGALKKKAEHYSDWFVCDGFQLSDTDVEGAGGPVFGKFKFTSGTYVVVRGTVTLADWKANLAYDPAEFLDQADFVHKGFLMRARNVPLEMIARDAEELIVAGHSLGGSAAVLAAVELMHKTGRLPMVFTFGQPSCFYKAFPPCLRVLASKVKAHVHRFSFNSDIVPTSTDRYSTGPFPENLICLSDNAPCIIQRRLDDVPPVPGVFEFESSKHGIDRHRSALLNAACLVEKVGTPKGFNGPVRSELDSFSLKVDGDLANSLADESVGGGKFLLEVRGSGMNAHIIKASLCEFVPNAATLNPIRGTQLKDISVSHPRSIIGAQQLGHDCDTVSFVLIFDVTNSLFEDTEVMLCMSNGFHTDKRKMSIQLNNVVVFGKMSHGKSTLISALEACAKGEPYPREVPRECLGINPENKCKKFTHGKTTFYEAVGVGSNDDVHLQVVRKALSKMPPRVVLILWKFGDALDDKSKDFHNMVKDILQGIQKLRNPDAVKVILVLTQCDKVHLPHFNAQYDSTVVELKQKFGMQEETSHFIVNSADAEGDQKKVIGVEKLYKHVQQALTASIPLQDVIQIGSMWSRFRLPVVTGALTTAAAATVVKGIAVGSMGPVGVGIAIGSVAVTAATVVAAQRESAPAQGLCCWMYTDASTGQFARTNPLRWSGQKSAEATIRELRFLTSSNKSRPLLLLDEQRQESHFATASAAISFLEP